MVCADLAVNACATPPILNAEFTMLSRLATTLRKHGRGIVSLRQRLFRRPRESEEGVGAQPGLVRDAKRVDDRPCAPSGEQVSPGHAEFIRTQSQLMETMLKAMIVASGWKVDGRPGGPG
jgi:hypothetical protein